MQDDSLSFTITLSALLEGFGNINYLQVENETRGTSNWWSPVESWSGVLEAVEADNIRVYVELINDGVATDTLFAEFVSAQVTPGEPLIQEIPSIDVGLKGSVDWHFIMPATNVNITINAGHVEVAI